MTTEIIAAVSTAALLIIGAVVTGVIQILNAMKDTKRVVEETRSVNLSQNKKLDNIEILVDGRYSLVLQELADMKLMFANRTGDPDDMLKADRAQQAATQQESRVTEVKGSA